jgi:Arc/MetJ-type ribon-helix-helix transcriptional regulator
MDGIGAKNMSESEKITINMSAVDLGKIDLLMQEGMYSNRTDFIRTAIRSQLERHNLEIQQSIARHAYSIGVLSYDRSDLEKQKMKGEKLKIMILGMLHLHDDISAELAVEAIESIKVLGIFIASDEVKTALAHQRK